ncbi:MAG: pyrroline-5-carboxylate reductase [Ruminococcus sp.]|nr:pyrroline-5-carboxylate reductase [Candidatus Copronaster equi]
MNKKIGFIGCGNMGGALIKAVANAGYSDSIFIADFDASKVKALSDSFGVNDSNSDYISENCDYIFIGVKPQVISDCFSSIKATLHNRKFQPVIVSMAAGVRIEDIKKMSGIDSIIRIMPNLPVSLGKGVVLACSENVNDENKSIFETLMSESGVFDWLDEKFIDCASAVSGCGPAYAYMFIEALADGAVACGLPRDKALLYAAGMLSGSAEMVMQSGKHPGKLKDEVCSPGGSTIAGVKALENGSFRGDVMNAVIDAYERTLELGK